MSEAIFKASDKLRPIRVTFSNGTVITTSVNAACSDEEIRAYYVGQEFNLFDGEGGDLMARGKTVEFLDSSEHLKLAVFVCNECGESYVCDVGDGSAKWKAFPDDVRAQMARGFGTVRYNRETYSIRGGK